MRCTNDDREALREEDCVAEQKPMSRRACAAKVDCDKTVFLVNKVVNHGPVKWVTRNWGKVRLLYDFLHFGIRTNGVGCTQGI